MTPQSRTNLGAPIVLVLVATLAWGLAVLGREDPLLGLPATQAALDAVSEIAGGIAAVLLAARLILGVAGNQATGFHRAIIHLLLTFFASFLIMGHFGFDLRAVLATSAIVTAAVGLAMQPTLHTMIAGLTLDLDGIVRLGDGLMHDGQLLRVTSMNWRSVRAWRQDNTEVIIPNSLISDRVTEVLRRGEPLRRTSTFFAPLDAPPERIAALVRDTIADSVLVDATRPVAVGPMEVDLALAAMRYRLRYSILNPFEQLDVEMELLRRIWYVFQRNAILLPVSRLFGATHGLSVPTIGQTVVRGWVRDALAAGGATHFDADPAKMTDALVRDGRLLLYAPDERIVLPDGLDDWRFLLVRGQAVQSHEYGLDQADPRRPPLPAWSLGPDAAVRRVAEHLARHIGPYAEIVVRRAARTATDLSALCRMMAEEIEDPDARARFLADVAPPDITTHGPGLMFRARRNAAGALICHLALRAQSEVAVIGVPPDLLDAQRPAAE